jgi:hypothetical protein
MHKNTTSPLSGWPWPGLPTVREALDNRAEPPIWIVSGSGALR